LNFDLIKNIVINQSSSFALDLKLKNLRIFNKLLNENEEELVKNELDFLLKRKKINELTNIYVDLKIEQDFIVKNNVTNERLNIESNCDYFYFNLEKGKNHFPSLDICDLFSPAYYNGRKLFVESEIEKFDNLIVSFWMRQDFYNNDNWFSNPARGIFHINDFHFNFTCCNLQQLRLDCFNGIRFERVSLPNNTKNYNHYVVYFRDDGVILFYFNKQLIKTFDIKSIGKNYNNLLTSHFIFASNGFDKRSYLNMKLKNLIIMQEKLTDDLLQQLYDVNIKTPKLIDEFFYFEGDINENN
jgi:hypothetical protein